MARRIAALGLLAAVILTMGCQSPVPSVVPGGIRLGTLVHDGPSDRAEAARALDEARTELPRVLAQEYDIPACESCLATRPATLERALTEVTCALVPCYRTVEFDPSTRSLFSTSTRKRCDYVLALIWRNRMFGAMSWVNSAYVAGGREDRGAWFCFEGGPSYDFPEAESAIRRYFRDRPVAVRYVRVPRGTWVVGRSGSTEKAAFVCDQGAYEDDPRPPGRLYDVSQVIAYGAPHGAKDLHY